MNQLTSLTFKNNLSITALHMITIYYRGILICQFLIQKLRICVIGLNWTISVKILHVSKGQTPHVLILSTLTKRHSFLIYLLSRQAFLITTVWLYKASRNIFQRSTKIYKIYMLQVCNNYNKKEFENVLKQRLVSWSNFQEFLIHFWQLWMSMLH